MTNKTNGKERNYIGQYTIDTMLKQWLAGWNVAEKDTSISLN